MKEFLENMEIGEGKVKLSKEEVKSILAESGKNITTEKTKVENAKQEEIDTLNKTITELKGQIENVPTSKEMEDLKKTIADFEKAETERKEAEKVENLENDYKTRYANVLGDKKFINEFTNDSFYGKFKENLQSKENKGKGDAEIFESMTKDIPNLFENPNKATTPGANEDTSIKSDDNAVREIMGLK